MSKELDLISEALTYAMEIFEENELDISPNMFESLRIIDEMKGK